MTYCAALKLEKGLVFGSDSRTNAGVDDIATFRKMKIFEKSGERVLVVLSSGTIAITQAALTMVEQRFHRWKGGEPLLSPRLRWTIEEDGPLFGILGREWPEGLKHLAAGLTGLPPPGSGKDRGLS